MLRDNIFIILLLFAGTKIIYSQQNNSVVEELEAKIHFLFDDSYGAAELVNVNEELGEDLYNRRGCYPVNDPYNTLKDSYLFYANSSDQNKDDFVGIYKSGEIIWHSKPVIYGQGADLIGTIDMNLDGNVEIIFAANIWGSGRGSDDVWIFSWDGKNGYCINSKNSEGHYIPLGMSFHTFSMDDLNGDGILEVRSHDKEDGSEAWSWNGESYGKWDSTPIVPFEEFQAAANAEADVECEISQMDTLFLYEYTVSNRSNSRRRIERIRIDHGLFDKSGNAPEGWNFGPAISKVPASWKYDNVNTKNLISPGESVGGFQVNSEGLPRIANFYIQSERGPWYGAKGNSKEVLAKMLDDIVNNSFKGKTITPYSPPDPFAPSGFLDTLISYTTKSFKLGWMSDNKTKMKYENYFVNTKNALLKSDSSAAQAYLKNVLADVDVDSSAALSSEAYALLKYNTGYLLKRLRN
jgi:hypothetical protein